MYSVHDHCGGHNATDDPQCKSVRNAIAHGLGAAPVFFLRLAGK